MKGLGRAENLTGQFFNGLEILRYAGRNTYNRTIWRVRCYCGEEFTAVGSAVKIGDNKSCGCLREKHGESETRLYTIWENMKQRCTNNNNKDYPRYGGRGIIMCKEWLNSYISFREWANLNGYKEELSIDRINNDKGYNPENCRWVNRSAQGRNKGISETSLSGVVGVHWAKRDRVWKVNMALNGKTKHIGDFRSLRKAAKARQQGEIKYWGYTRIADDDINNLEEYTPL